MKPENDNVRSIAAARKAKEQAARRASTFASEDNSIRMQVWVLLAAVACAYLAYAYVSGVGQ